MAHDQVLHAHAFPTHHKDERRGDVLETVYAIHSGYAVSILHMIFQEMCKVNRLFKESKKDMEKKRPLPFPHLLTILFFHRPGPADVPLSIPSDEESIPFHSLSCFRNEFLRNCRMIDPPLQHVFYRFLLKCEAMISILMRATEQLCWKANP